MKAYLRAIVKGGDRARAGMGVELFRLDAADAPELTEEEAETAATAEADGVEPTTTAIMRIYEEIGIDFWTGEGITAKSFAEDLEAFGDIKRLNIHINCLGGDVFAAQAIHSTIADHKAHKSAYIDGVCASAATVIACGADEVIARHNTSYMVHHPWAMAVGDAETMRKAARDLDAITVPILSVYKNKVGDKITEDEIRQLMADETWMTPEEALAKGFVDTVRGKIRAIARVGAGQIICSGKVMDAGRYGYRNMPRWSLTKQRSPAAAAGAPPEIKQKGKKPMTLEDITPELRATIEDGARTAERTRLAALDALNGPGLEDIVARAKAENKQPNDIALECLAVTKGQLSASQATSALARDAAAARAVPAGDAPARPAAEKPEATGARLVANAFKSQKARGLANAVSPNGHRN